MGILLTLLLGAIAGWLSGYFVRKESNIIVNIIVGILGAMLGGWIFETLGAQGVTGFNLYSIVVAVIGSVVLVSVVNFISHSTK